MTELWQHVVVTVAAIGAAGVLARQLMAFLAPPRVRSGPAAGSDAACSNCPSGTVKRKRNSTQPAPVIHIQGLKKS